MKNTKRFWNKLFLTFGAISTPTLILASCATNFSNLNDDSNSQKPTPEPSPEPEPEPIIDDLQPEPITPEPKPIPITPKPKIIEQKFAINRKIMRNFIQENEKGYSPKAVSQALKFKQIQQNDINWLKAFLTAEETSNVQWRDLTFFKFENDEEQGTLDISFKVKNQNLAISLNSADGLMKTTDYFDQVKDLSFSLNVAYESVALAATRKNPQWDKSAWDDENGVQLGNDTYYTADEFFGTAWVIDRIKQADDQTSDTLSYLVGTNIHVINSVAPFINRTNGNNTLLDPVNINYGWKRNSKGKSHSGFSDTLVDQEDLNLIPNLKFGNENVFKGQRDQVTKTAIQNKNAAKIQSWFQPNEMMKSQKKNFLDSIIYVPNHKTKTYIAGQELTYESLGADFMVLRMDFKKSDLKREWAPLYNSFESNTEDKLFMKFNTTKLLDLKDTFYSGGYPGYYSSSRPSVQKIYEDEGFDIEKQTQGEYWKAATFNEFILPGIEAWENTMDEALTEPWTYKSVRKTEIENLFQIIGNSVLEYISHYDQESFDRMYKKNVNIVENIEGNQVSQNILEKSKPYIIANHGTDIENKTMLNKIYKTAKQHIIAPSSYFFAGNSGSIVTNAKREIVGIMAAILPEQIINGHKNALFYDFYNDHPKVQGDKIYGKEIANKISNQNIKTIVINP